MTTSTATTSLLLLLLLLLSLAPSRAHDWIGANGTPDCECLPHFKLDCANLAPVQKAWRTLVSRKCNATVDDHEEEGHYEGDGHDHSDHTAAASPRQQKVSKLKDAAADAHEEDNEAPTYKCAVDQACYEAFHQIIGHHYGCPPEFLPREIGEQIHLFQTPGDGRVPDVICQGCFQPRYVSKSEKPMCPKLSCHHNEEALMGNATLAEEQKCAQDCSSDACKSAYQFLRVHHDGCVLNDNPLSSRMAADRLRAACSKHECTFSNSTYAAGTYEVDCAREKNAGPFKVVAPAEGPKVAVDHSAHNHGAESTAPSNVASSSAAGLLATGVIGAVVAAAMVVMMTV
jgi:hypothetical protein